MEPGLFFFWLFSAVVVVGAVGVVVMRQPIHSALFLLLSFLGVACLYVQARAELVAAVQVLVYAGGVMVLFLYTIMLVNVKRRERVSRIIEAKIGRLANQRTPRNHPSPECGASMVLEPPYRCIAAVMYKELGQHLSVRADAKELGMGA